MCAAEDLAHYGFLTHPKTTILLVYAGRLKSIEIQFHVFSASVQKYKSSLSCGTSATSLF